MTTFPYKASNTLVTNLNNSINSAPAGWIVVAVQQLPAYNPVPTAPIDIIVGLYTTKLNNPPAPLNVQYQSLGNPATAPYGILTFYSAVPDLQWQFYTDPTTTPGSTLDATIRSAAYSYLSALDSPFATILSNGPQTPPTDPALIPSTLLSDLNSSLVLGAAGWTCLGRNESIVIQQQIVDGIIQPRTVRIISTTLRATNRFVPGSTSVTLTFCHTQQIDYVTGAYLSGIVNILGATWRTLDTTLQTNVNNIASTFLGNQATGIEGVLP